MFKHLVGDVYGMERSKLDPPQSLLYIQKRFSHQKVILSFG